MDDEHSTGSGPRGHAKLGPLTAAFISPDDVARHLHERIGSRRDVEYGSVIMQRLSDGLYVGTEPLPAEEKTFSFRLLLDVESPGGAIISPEGYQLVASLHSHPDAYAETQRQNPALSPQQINAHMSFYSWGDIVFNSDFRMSLGLAYLSGPDGALLRYQTRFSKAEQQYARWLNQGSPGKPPEGHDGTVEGNYKKLAAVGSLRFLVSSPVWGGSVGDVPANWEPYKRFDAPALQLPCGPVFTSRELALAYAKTRMERESIPGQRVLILRHRIRNRFLVSEPQSAEPTLGRQPPLPAGFLSDGFYVNAQPVKALPELVLSPGFVSADDAARWAHENIGNRRDVEYGGVILKRDLRYYATEPVPDQRYSFDHGLLLAKEGEGNFIAPEGYLCEAFYHSHPADAEQIKARFADFTADQVTLFNNFYSVADQTFSIENRAFAKVHYFSGPDDVLLKYVSSGTASEKQFYAQLRDGTFEASSDFESVIWRLAEAGELWVLVANAVWGGVRGRVNKGWRMREPVAAASPPLLQPFFTALSSSSQEAISRALSAARASNQKDGVGFVLKHTGQDLYVATTASPRLEPLFSPQGLFPRRPDGKLRLPSQFRLEAIYYRSSPSANDIPSREPWLYTTFFSPAEIVAAITQARATEALQVEARGLELYVQTTDGALLTLKVPLVSDAAELVRLSSDGRVDDKGAQQALVAGSLSPREFVRRVLSVTDVRVVTPGDLWRVVGSVDHSAAVLTPFYQAQLSRPFLSPLDAAVHAHEKIGGKRSSYYGGYVLKAQDGRFVITEPLVSEENPFAAPLFFPAGGKGPLIPPQTYVVEGRYGAHPALSMVDYDWVQRRRWGREEASINLQVFSPDEIHSVVQQGQRAYLSGAQDCLLSYMPSGSDAEKRLASGGNSVQQRIASGLVTPAQWVVHLATMGDLRVIQGNALWGPRSPVYRDWTPAFEYAPRVGPPDVVLYSALFDTEDAVARDLHARTHGRNLPEQACFAFILKHQEMSLYMATEVIGVNAENELFRLDSAFVRTGDSDYQFPDGFVLHGVFRSQQWQPADLAVGHAWLTRFFVMPMVLYQALHAARLGGDKYNKGLQLSSYFSTQDGALLRYVSLPFSSNKGEDADKPFKEATTDLAAGIVSPQTFVRQCIKDGQLDVLRTSQCWDKAGRVSATWTGYEHLVKRRLSPMFNSPDDAVRHAAALIGSGRERVYGGVVLRLPGNLYVATDPLVVPPQGFAFNWVYPDPAVSQGLYPAGCTLIARYRSVVEREVQVLFSPTEKAVYQSMLPTAVLAELVHRDIHVKRDYLVEPDGVILSFDLRNGAQEEMLKRALAPLDPLKRDYADNDIERQIRQGTLLPSDFVTQVIKAGTLRVVNGNALWGMARTLSVAFVPNPAVVDPLQVRQVFADAACSPVFTQAYDAVRHAQRTSSSRSNTQFGYVLKAQKKEVYMTSLALVRKRFAKLEQVFIDGQLPPGYEIVGLYLRASSAAIAVASDEMSHSFFSPEDIGRGISFVNNFVKNGPLPLYLLCADGALLKYTITRDVASLSELSRNVRVTTAQLQAGTLKVADYVRTLGTKGDLYVRKTSTVWGREERVTLQWAPRAMPWPFADNPHFHSFCGPLFNHADDAARWAQKQLGRYAGTVYLGAVLSPGTFVGFVAIDPVEVRTESTLTTLEMFFWLDHLGFDVPARNPLHSFSIAAVHAFYPRIASTQSALQLDKNLLENFVEQDDLRRYVDVLKSNRPFAECCYLSSRGGALLKYVPAFSTEEATLLRPGNKLEPSQWVSRLRGVGHLSVLLTDAFWTRMGELGKEWKTESVQAEPEVDDGLYIRPHDEL
ncbi:DUF4329 domain-containing protein [Pseudomonas sp. HN11]|uniref:DUF4329 domain-containing protein n=1 Tax=Pseudomonas sp. HN11 TaxID=1344094 RepID=UPI001F181635|nr:DUF4329 domain-containing protein [Pseudomonas sp. HN11]UII72140.1 DUF4329 domain-containing protein [Pseudomonas sp. HN11]